MISRTGADKSMAQFYDGEKKLGPNDEVVLRKNNRAVHIFRSTESKKCLCGTTSRSHFARNHIWKKAKAYEIIKADSPSDVGILGKNFPSHGVAKLGNEIGEVAEQDRTL